MDRYDVRLTYVSDTDATSQVDFQAERNAWLSDGREEDARPDQSFGSSVCKGSEEELLL
jgi:hypothetical protein